MEKVYKVELTEKEAQRLGEGRWMAKKQWRYFLPITGAVLAMFGVLVLSSMDSIPDAVGWGSLPFAGLSVFLTIRGAGLQTKAGRKFVQSLKKEK